MDSEATKEHKGSLQRSSNSRRSTNQENTRLSSMAYSNDVYATGGYGNKVMQSMYGYRDSINQTKSSESAIQRKEETEPSPLWYKLTADFYNYYTDMAAVNQPYPTTTRSRWSYTLSVLSSHLGGPGEKTEQELLAIQQALVEYKKLFEVEHEEAVDLFETLTQAYEAERSDLLSSELLEDIAAREILEELYKDTDQRVLGTGEFLVVEDLLVFQHMLANQKHIAQGQRKAKAEIEKRRRLEKEFEEEEEVKDPGVLETVWDVVGWDSPEEFAGDVVLTIVTLGTSKGFKLIRKGSKALAKARDIKKLARLRKLRMIQRLERLAEGAAKLLKAVGEALDGLEIIPWIKANWFGLARAYVTDELGEKFGGGDASGNKNVIERLNKELVGEYISRILGITGESEREQFNTALRYYAFGYSNGGKKELRRYFIMNIKRRLLSNLVFNGLRVATPESKLSPEVISAVVTSTIGEVSQDLFINFNKVAGADVIPQSLVETARKTIQTLVHNFIVNGLK